MGGSERPTRKGMRYPVKETVSFWWKDEHGNKRHGEGTSRDISETGAFVHAPVCPPVGAHVELRVFFAQLAEGTRLPRMKLEGRVLRVEQIWAGKGSSGFAVFGKGGVLRENDESGGEGDPRGNYPA